MKIGHLASLPVFALVFSLAVLPASVFPISNVYRPCQIFVNNAQGYLGNGSCYINCFLAAQEYLHAGNCAKEKSLSYASDYYSLAAKSCSDVLPLLVSGGDFKLRGGCFELIGDTYSNTDNQTKAREYYDLARAEYQKGNLKNELNALNAKLGIPDQSVPGIIASGDYWLLIAAALIMVFVLLGLYYHRGRFRVPHSSKNSTSFEHSKPSEHHGHSGSHESGKSGFDFIAKALEEKPSVPKSSVEPPSARERAKEKLRRKYGRGF